MPIAALYNRAVGPRSQRALQLHQVLTYLRDGGDGRDVAGDLVLPDNAGDVFAVKNDLGGVRIVGDLQRQVRSSANDGGGIRRVHTRAQHRQGGHAVHGAGILSLIHI